MAKGHAISQELVVLYQVARDKFIDSEVPTWAFCIRRVRTKVAPKAIGLPSGSPRQQKQRDSARLRSGDISIGVFCVLTVQGLLPAHPRMVTRSEAAID